MVAGLDTLVLTPADRRFLTRVEAIVLEEVHPFLRTLSDLVERDEARAAADGDGRRELAAHAARQLVAEVRGAMVERRARRWETQRPPPTLSAIARPCAGAHARPDARAIG